MDQILSFLQQHPEAQAAVAGALVSVAISLYKRLRPQASDEETAKLRQTLTALLLSLVAGAITTTASGAGWWPALLLNAATAWLASQAVYGAGKSAQRVGAAAADTAAAVAVRLTGGVDD